MFPEMPCLSRKFCTQKPIIQKNVIHYDHHRIQIKKTVETLEVRFSDSVQGITDGSQKRSWLDDIQEIEQTYVSRIDKLSYKIPVDHKVF